MNLAEKIKDLEGWPGVVLSVLIAAAPVAVKLMRGWLQRRAEMKAVERSTAWDAMAKHLIEVQTERDLLREQLAQKEEQTAQLYERLIESDAKTEAARALIETVREEFRRLQRSAPSVTRADDAATPSTDTSPNSLPRPPRLPRTRK